MQQPFNQYFFFLIFFQQLCRRVLENQHKFVQILAQQIRLCSSTARAQEAPKFNEESGLTITPTPVRPIGSIAQQIEHAEDIGQQFSASDLNVRLASPQQLQPKPDCEDLGFGKYFTDHMLKIFYHKSLGGWQKPEITPFENLVIHPAAKVLHYAVEVSFFYQFKVKTCLLGDKILIYGVIFESFLILDFFLTVSNRK